VRLIIFGIGLFKKTWLADRHPAAGLACFGPATPSFDQAGSVRWPNTFQLYFDFSGYSDMAIGFRLMFGIFLPLNFNSPYKASSIIDSGALAYELSQFPARLSLYSARRQ